MAKKVETSVEEKLRALFDLQLIDSLGVTVHAFDPTPRSVEWVKEQELPQEFIFHPVGLAAENGFMSFYPPAKSTSTHFSPVARLSLIHI